MSMQIIDWPRFLKNPLESALTIGVFDGIHIGHRELIARVVRRGPNPTVITFRENPKKLLAAAGTQTVNFEGEICSLRQKLAVFEKLGMNRIVLIDFSEEFSKLEGRAFFDLLRDPGRVIHLVIGSDFRCGYRQDTGADSIVEMSGRLGISAEVVPPVSLADSPVSSSRIRSAILSGDLRQAALLLGRNYELDLAGIGSWNSVQSGGVFYDLRSANRVAPVKGRYPVLLNPVRIKAALGADVRETLAFTENGKLYLPEKAESIEFI